MADQDLDQHIQALPQELQDIIFDFTLSPDSDRVVTVTPGYRPPTQLQISCASRNIAAERYYTNSAFAFSECEDTGCNSLDLMKKWLSSLTPEHVSMLTEVRSLATKSISTEPNYFQLWINFHGFRAWLEGNRIKVDLDALRTQYDKEGEERKWLSCKDVVAMWEVAEEP